MFRRIESSNHGGGEHMYRPIINLPKTKREKVWDYIGGGVFLASIALIFVLWGEIPDEIPGHFNGLGEVDRWGSKFELFILPCIGLFLWIMMSLLEKAPHMHNYPARLNESNVEKFYLNSRKALNEIKNVCLIMFAILIFQIIKVSLGKLQSLGWWFTPLLIIGMVAFIIKAIITSSKIK